MPLSLMGMGKEAYKDALRNLKKHPDDELFSRSRACEVMGIWSDVFGRDFKSNSLYLAYGAAPIPKGRATLYKNIELQKQIERLADPLRGCQLYVDWRSFKDGKITLEEWFAIDHFGERYVREPNEVINEETYLAQIDWNY